VADALLVEEEAQRILPARELLRARPWAWARLKFFNVCDASSSSTHRIFSRTPRLSFHRQYQGWHCALGHRQAIPASASAWKCWQDRTHRAEAVTIDQPCIALERPGAGQSDTVYLHRKLGLTDIVQILTVRPLDIEFDISFTRWKDNDPSGKLLP
jgi:hypothetical protein